MNKVLGRERILDLPDHDSLSDLLERFNGYFIDKITTIRQGLEQSEVHMDTSEDTATATESLTAFQPASQKEVLKAVRRLATKSCPIDPLPTWMLKQHLGTLLPTITEIATLSLATGTFPSQFKEALVTPVLRKPSLDVNVPCKEVPTGLQLALHLQGHGEGGGAPSTAARPGKRDAGADAVGVPCPAQYRDCARQSLQRPAVRIDQRKAVILILIDLSGAFDIIDHDILLQRPQRRCGIAYI